MLQPLIVVALIILSIVGFLPPVLARWRRIKEAPGELALEPFGERVRRVVFEVLLQTKVIRERPLVGLAHAFVFWGFLVFALVTTDHFAQAFYIKPLYWFGPEIGDCIMHFASVWAVIVTLAILGLAFRRFVIRPAVLGDHVSGTSAIVAFLIVTLMVTHILGFYQLGHDTLAGQLNWWIHALAIIVFPPLIVRSKHIHLLIGPFAVFFKNDQIGQIQPLNFEAEEFGVEKAGELNKQIALGAFSCVECGRCQDQCPASGTGKKLNPKQVALDIRKAILTAPQEEAVGKHVDQESLWDCTTCGSCAYQCPVGMDQVAPILEFRRSQVSEGEFPEAFGALFKNLERAGNPWSYSRDKAEDRIKDLGLPTYDGQAVLWWMGCMARYDDNYLSTVAAFAKILNAAGVSFGVLENEKCTGDAARRAGNEMAFAELAMHNIELLNESGAKFIVTTCPHCAKALEEYKELGPNQGLDEGGLKPEIQIDHAVKYVSGLYKLGKFSLAGAPLTKGVILHDPCYLSRHEVGGNATDMRNLVEMGGAAGKEPGRTKNTSFCCGGGGAQAFDDEGGDKYIYRDRADELLALGDDPIATACPFCHLMLRDGLKDNGVEDLSRLVDVLDLIAARLPE